MAILYGPNGQLIGAGIVPDSGGVQFGASYFGGLGLSAPNLSSALSVNPQDFTLTLWVYIATTAPTDPTYLFMLGNGTNMVFLELDNGPAQFFLGSENGGGDHGALLKGWYFVAITGLSTVLTIYFKRVNGDFTVGTTTNTTGTGAGTIVYGNSINFNISGPAGFLTDGLLWSYAKSERELYLQSLQRQPVSPYGLVSHVPLRNFGSMKQDLVSRVAWTVNGTGYLNFRAKPPVPEVAQHSNFPLLMSHL